MQTDYTATLTPAIKGMPVLAPRHSRPRQLVKLPQINRLTIANGAGTDNVVITLTDDKTGQVWTLPTVTGSANEATLGAAIRAAVAADPKFATLVSVAAVQEVDASDLILDFTARHANRSYTLASVGGPSGASAAGAVTETQAPGGSGLEFGQLVVAGTNPDEFAQLSASSTLRDIVGFLFRGDGNHYHALPLDLGDEDPVTTDTCERGVHYAIAEEGEFWVQVEEAVTPASRVYVRVEGSSVGNWGDSPGGTAQVATLTVVADHQYYQVAGSVIVAGREIEFAFGYGPTDGTTATDDVIDGLEDAAAAAITATGLTGIVAASAASAADAMTLTLASGYTWGTAPYFASWGEDTEATAGTVTAGTVDVDMLDVSSIARYTSSAAAGGLAKVKIQLQP